MNLLNNRYSVFVVYDEPLRAYFIRNDMIVQNIDFYMGGGNHLQRLVRCGFDVEFVNKICSMFVPGICTKKINKLSVRPIGDKLHYEHDYEDIKMGNNAYESCLMTSKSGQRFIVKKLDINDTLTHVISDRVNVDDIIAMNKFLESIGEKQLIKLDDVSGNELQKILDK